MGTRYGYFANKIAFADQRTLTRKMDEVILLENQIAQEELKVISHINNFDYSQQTLINKNVFEF